MDKEAEICSLENNISEEKLFIALQQFLSSAKNILERNKNSSFFVVFVSNTGKPQIFQEENIESVINRYKKLQEQEKQNIDSEKYVYIFEGFWWRRIRGAQNGFTDGQRVVPLIQEPDDKNIIDDSGLLVD